MAEIFGMGNQGGMGILGAAQQTQPWQSTLGILASALKDATNSFSGNGGDTDNLSKWNATQGQNQQRQQLIAGLTSEDPAIRQQAYGIAPLFGVDPSAFQKQRAAQAFPQLLTAMQPQQVTAPAAQADAGEFGKINVPASNLGMAPGMNFGEALSIVNSPELTGQYVGKLIDQALEGPKFQEVNGGLYRLPGMNGGDPEQVIAPALKAPTTREVRIGSQQVTQEFDTKTGAWREVGRGAAFKPDSASDSASGVVVAPGGQLVDRKTGRPLYTAPPKKLPASVQNAESDDIAAIQTGRAISKDLGVIKNQIDSGQLVLGPFANTAGAAMNYLGVGNDNSHRLASFKSTLEKLRNDSLRLNKGVQTEGDAQRAWNEVMNNLNDKKLVSERLQEIQDINNRAANFRAQNIDLRRRNFDYPDFDPSQINPEPALGRPGSTGNPNRANTPPAGVDATVWSHMTPQERALWNR